MRLLKFEDTKKIGLSMMIKKFWLCSSSKFIDLELIAFDDDRDVYCGLFVEFENNSNIQKYFYTEFSMDGIERVCVSKEYDFTENDSIVQIDEFVMTQTPNEFKDLFFHVENENICGGLPVKFAFSEWDNDSRLIGIRDNCVYVKTGNSRYFEPKANVLF